ncbi:transposase [Sinorhizobium psoraleae]|uniref:transposase n=1 Tax=Sinorhizobium psoraleae TaxID=520838 RepID=UPI0035E3E0E6
MARMEIISGVERRRRWSKEAKLEILAEADRPGVRIGDVARRHDIYPAQSVYGGRHLATSMRQHRFFRCSSSTK